MNNIDTWLDDVVDNERARFSGKKKLALILTVLAILSISTIGVISAPAKEDYLKFVNQRVELTYAYTTYHVCNPTFLSYNDGMGLKWVGDNKYVRNVKIEKLANVSYTYQQAITQDKTVCRGHAGNKTESCRNETITLGWKNYTGYKEQWVNWDNKIDAGKCHYIRVYAKLDAVLGERKIEHIPTVAGIEFKEYDWWNTTWDKRKIIRVNRTKNANDIQQLIRIDHDSDMDVCGDDIRFINSSSAPYGEIYAYNVSMICGSYYLVYINLTGSNNWTFWMYYDNSSYVSPAWSLEKTADWGDRFTDYTIGNDLVGQGGWASGGVDTTDIDVTGTGCYDDGYCATDISDDSQSRAQHTHTASTTGTSFVRAYFEGSTPNRFGGTRAGATFLWFERTLGLVTEYKSGGWKVLFSYTKADNWYWINYTQVDATHHDMCIANATFAKCAFNIANYASGSGTGDTTFIEKDEQGDGNPKTWWDDTAYFNTTTGVSFSFGSEEQAPDSIPPIIIIYQPFNVTYTNNSIEFNITANEPLSWAGVQLLSTNHSLTNQSGQWQYFNGTLGNAQYTATFWFNDTTGNMNSSARTFTLDVPVVVPVPNIPFYIENRTTGNWVVNITREGDINLTRTLTIGQGARIGCVQIQDSDGAGWSYFRMLDGAFVNASGTC